MEKHHMTVRRSLEIVVVVITLFALNSFQVFAESIEPAPENAGFLIQEDGADFDTWGDWWGRRGDTTTRQAIEALGSEKVIELSIPILLGVEVSDLPDNFGDLRGGGTRTHEGHDTHAPKDTPIVSPTPAVVTRIADWSSAGKVVYTANPGGETFVYMHLNRFAEGLSEGDVLARGDLIGYVGNTGNAINAGDHLHFEIRDGGTPTDPLPRLVQEFSIQEKMDYLSAILDKQVDRASYVSFINQNFQGELQNAVNAGIPLAEGLAIESAGTVFVETTSPPATISYEGDIVPLDMEVGDQGSSVVWLQTFLIEQDLGERARYLGRTGATGYFGPITRDALAEYQLAVGIAPASGYYGPLTRGYINTVVLADNEPVDAPPVVLDEPAIEQSDIIAITRDLERGVEHPDVRILQQYLNTIGYLVATTGFGSPGNETDYFGPATERALARFQDAYGISPSIGYFGPITRSVIASL